MAPFFGKDGEVLSSDQVIQKLSNEIDFSQNQEFFIPRLSKVVDLIYKVEDIQIANKDNKFEYREMKTTGPDGEEIKETVKLGSDLKCFDVYILDFGGQEQWSFLYEQYYKIVNSMIILWDFDNSIQSKIKLDQEFNVCEKVQEEYKINGKEPKIKSYTYVISKIDKLNVKGNNPPFNWLPSNPFDNDEIYDFQKANSVIPSSTFKSFDYDGVKAIFGTALLKHVQDKGDNLVLKLGITGSGDGGKTSIIRRLKLLLEGDNGFAPLTVLTPGPSGENVRINSDFFYYKNEQGEMSFVNEEGQLMYTAKVNSLNEQLSIKEFTVTPNGGEPIIYNGSQWPEVIKDIKDYGATAVFDLELTSYIARCMFNPSEWGLSDNVDEFGFPRKNDFKKTRFNEAKYVQELAYYIKTDEQ